jgi:hypothetical protein
LPKEHEGAQLSELIVTVHEIGVVWTQFVSSGVPSATV